ncbi:MAG: glucosamine-6-phosphate deaminase [Erysipelotrichaceae bacterium]
MKVIITKNYEELSKEAFKIMKTVLTDNENPVLGLATGSSPVGLYQEMIKDHQTNNTDYSNVVTFNLDEYVGLNKNHSQSYYTFMHENLFNHINVKEENIHLPSGVGNIEENAKKYEDALNSVTLDVQLLGIGSNGHIGFNEPGTSFDSVTHEVTLKESTIKDNSRFFIPLNEEVPTKAISMGIASIMKAKKVLIVASGTNKADAVYAMVKGPVSTDCPASVLQNHLDVVLVVDEAAAAKL